MHMHRTGKIGKTDERNLTCGAPFLAVTISDAISFGIGLARSLAFFLNLSFSRFLSLSLYLSLSLSVVFVANFLRTMSYVPGVI